MQANGTRWGFDRPLNNTRPSRSYGRQTAKAARGSGRSRHTPQLAGSGPAADLAGKTPTGNYPPRKICRGKDPEWAAKGRSGGLIVVGVVHDGVGCRRWPECSSEVCS